MKKRFLLPVAIGLFAFVARNSANHHTFKSIHPMAYAVDVKGQVIDSAQVNEMGNYQFAHLLPGTYNVIISAPGQENITITGVEHMGPSYSYHYQSQVPGEYTYNGASSTRGSRADGVDDYSDGAAYRYAPAATRGSVAIAKKSGVRRAESAKDIPGDAMIMTLGTSSTGSHGGGSSGIKPGQITAGNWRDLDNWDKWKETNKTESIAAFQQNWGFFTNNRFSVQFVDKNNKPVIGAKVSLIENGKTLQWESITDNKGNAELWAGLNSEISTKEVKTYKINVVIGENKYEFSVKPFKGSADVFNLPISTNVTATADVAFVVDATGSMGDEIQYLQSELLDVATRIKKTNQCVNFRLGSVFYRDHGDNYVTIKSDFNENITNVANFIFDQSAGGGGDFPEAVDDAMETAIDKLEWSENAISRIMFLILDAPPHEDQANKERMQKYTKLAAQKGIKIIPVVASGINQSTEFLMKYLAISTNGNYVYITDHSGIGNAHEKPTGVKENVQYLNDLMVDIINENTKWEGCKDADTNNPNTPQPGTVEILTHGQWQVQVYPNPATDKIMIKSNELPDEIGIYDLTGNLIKKVEQLQPEKNTISVNEMSTGVYIVRCRKGEKLVSCRILVMH